MKKLIFCSLFFFVGCIRPYDVPEFVEVGTSETGFLIPLQGDTTKQVAFDSEQYLQKNMVSAKRIQVSHEWRQTGRFSYQGQWVPSVRLIKIDRSPETREWSSDPNSGTSNKNEAIWAESKDSVGFSTGINCTARIPDNESAVKFLFNYPAPTDSNSAGVAMIMDREIRAQIQGRMSEFSNFYNLDELREKKTDMMKYIKFGILTPEMEAANIVVESGVIDFFKERGIEITNIGQFGGFSYENPKIQEAIDNVFQSQQDEEVAKAESLAQKERNEAVKLAAEGLAEAAKLKAMGEAEAIQTVADAKAYEIEKAQQNWEQYVSLKQFEIEESRLEKWDGKYPQNYFGQQMEGLNPVMLNLNK